MIIDYNHKEDTCFICNKKFVKSYKIIKDIDYNLIEIDIITSHTRCRILMDKRRKLINQLLDVNFQLFCLMD